VFVDRDIYGCVQDASAKLAIMNQTLCGGEGKGNPSTRSNNGEITCSDFVPDGDNHWVWQLSFKGRGIIEYVRILSVKKTSGLPTTIIVEDENRISKAAIYALAINFDKRV